MKCEFEDGRKPVNRKEVTLSKSNNRPLTWTPRHNPSEEKILVAMPRPGP